MGNKDLLTDYWKDSGKTKTHLSKRLNISRPRLNKIFDDPISATTSQAFELKSELNIIEPDFEEIFLLTK